MTGSSAQACKSRWSPFSVTTTPTPKPRKRSSTSSSSACWRTWPTATRSCRTAKAATVAPISSSSPRTPGQPAFVFEFKAAATADAETLRTAASAALDQAATCDYSAALRQAEVTTLYTLGLASHGKRIALASTVRSLPDGQPSERAYHLAGPEPEPLSGDAARSRSARKPKKARSQARDQEVNPARAIHLQLLQQNRGLPVTPLEVVMRFSPTQIETMILALTP